MPIHLSWFWVMLQGLRKDDSRDTRLSLVFLELRDLYKQQMQAAGVEAAHAAGNMCPANPILHVPSSTCDLSHKQTGSSCYRI
jgi:hypothetical protein